MSDYTDTPEGWREVGWAEYRRTQTEDPSAVRTSNRKRYWVRESPVPALPNVPYTVIRVTEAHSVLLLTEDGWVSQFGTKYNADDLAQITSFVVLSEPRAVTAKAVLDRVVKVMSRAHVPDDVWPQIDAIAREFKVVES